MDRREVSTGTEWEAEFGYARAVRVGDTIRVAGTTAVDNGEPVAPGDPYEQTRYALETIGDALDELEAGPADVLSTTIYVVDFEDWDPTGDDAATGRRSPRSRVPGRDRSDGGGTGVVGSFTHSATSRGHSFRYRSAERCRPVVKAFA
jgi:enamine deaminase RidA (YjgF/YER057c/UK114 family)